MEVTWLWPMMEYVRSHQAKIVEYISGHPIFELCTGLIVGRYIAGFFVCGTRIMVRQKRG